MPFLTPQYMGKKVGSSFLEEYPNTTKETFMDEGLELSKQYREEHAQKRYLQGWRRAFDELRETPMDVGKKDAIEYLKMYPTVTKGIFMDEGRADIERDYKEKDAQEEYIKGWDSAWPIEAEGDFRKAEF